MSCFGARRPMSPSWLGGQGPVPTPRLSCWRRPPGRRRRRCLRPAQVQAYAGSSTARPASPRSSGANVSTMTADSSKYSTPSEASIADGCGPWAIAARVQGDRADADAGALARLVVAADVEHDLVAVDVGVVVGHRDRELVVVDLARQEVADHEVPALEDLVHRRRLVDLAGDRHVVVDVERVGVEAAVPADDVERVGRVGHPGADDPGAGAVLDQHVDVARPPARASGSVGPCRSRSQYGACSSSCPNFDR